MAEAEQINPNQMLWARETAGLSVEEAAGKLGLRDTGRATASEKLRGIEDGTRGVGMATLRKAVSLYRRPLVAFYMTEPPARGDLGGDFRTARAVSPREDGTLDALLRDIRARQQMPRQVLEDEDEGTPRPFVGSARVEHGVERVAASLRSVLNVSKEEQRDIGGRNNGPNGLFALLRTASEQAGIFVLLLGDMGTHRSDVGEDVFRGFALADEVAPFVVINDNDAATARPFTLMHELAHIWLGASGVSGPLQEVSERAVERFCNDVASEFLLPSDSMRDPGPLGNDLPTVAPIIERVAKEWAVSEPAVAYRYARNGWIDQAVAAALFAMFADRWRRQKQRARDTRDGDETGPSYYVVRRHRLGAALLGVVRRALQGDTITHTRAAKILGVSPASVAPLLRERLQAA